MLSDDALILSPLQVTLGMSYVPSLLLPGEARMKTRLSVSDVHARVTYQDYALATGAINNFLTERVCAIRLFNSSCNADSDVCLRFPGAKWQSCAPHPGYQV